MPARSTSDRSECTITVAMPFARGRPCASRPCSAAASSRSRRGSSRIRPCCSSTRRKGSARSPRGATPTREKAYETLRQLSPGTAEVHARLGLIYFQQGKFSEADSAAARGHQAEARPAEGRCAAGHVAVGARQVRRGAAGPGEGLLAIGRPRASAHGRPAPAAHLHRPRTRSGCRRRRAAPLAPPSRRPRGAVSLRPAVREFRLSADDEAGGRRARLRVAAPGGGRSEREPGALRRGAPRIPAGACARAAPARASISASAACCSNDRGKAIRRRICAEARKAFEEELALDPTNANAAYEIAEMHRKAGELEPRAQAVRAGADALSGVRGSARRTGANARSRSAGRPRRCRTSRRRSKQNPENEVAYYQLAQAYRALGKHRRAGEGARRVHTAAQPGGRRRAAAVPETKRDVTPQGLDVKPPK